MEERAEGREEDGEAVQARWEKSGGEGAEGLEAGRGTGPRAM